MKKPLVTAGQDWNFKLIDEMYGECEKINNEKYQLDIFPNQIEIISSEQMLDAYASHGLPLYYSHWSFGKSFVQQQEMYKRGYMGLAYEIVINSSPCIAYLMEENTMLMQTLVTAHACFGHNYFFKNNYMFKQWTSPDAIIDYLGFAKKYIQECEEKYGYDEVEAVIDAAHTLSMYGVDKYKRPVKLNAHDEKQRMKEREEWNQKHKNVLWQTLPNQKDDEDDDENSPYKFPLDPEENILYFIEKNAPYMDQWKREILRIVRKTSTYFMPQMYTKMMNEGTATFFHYNIIHDLHEAGIIDEGAMLEFYTSHTGVVFQADYNDPRFNGINPYALGFAMMNDIKRVSIEPNEEDLEWFEDQDWVGNGDWLGNIKFAIENFKDESFVQQYLSPKVIRDFRLFVIHDHYLEDEIEISAIHNKKGYKKIRENLATDYNIGYQIPDIQVTNVDRRGSRKLTLQHNMFNKRPLEHNNVVECMNHISYLWGYDVELVSVESNGEVRAMYDMVDGQISADFYIDD
jgi:stage V sporulation protein R